MLFLVERCGFSIFCSHHFFSTIFCCAVRILSTATPLGPVNGRLTARKKATELLPDKFLDCRLNGQRLVLSQYSFV